MKKKPPPSEFALNPKALEFILDSDNSESSNSEVSVRSVFSTPRQKDEADFLQSEKLMPFDFQTQRKVKKFFNDPVIGDLTRAMLDKIYAHKSYKSLKQRDEIEEEEVRELPEMSYRMQALLQINAGKKFDNYKKSQRTKLRIRGQNSTSSSEDEQNAKFAHYARKVQNIQIRGDNNELERIYFLRSQAKNFQTKRHLYEKISDFKQGISPTQLNVLKNRQFVMVDMKTLKERRKLAQKYNNEGKIERKLDQNQLEQQNKEQIAYDYYQKKAELVSLAKRNILKTVEQYNRSLESSPKWGRGDTSPIKEEDSPRIERQGSIQSKQIQSKEEKNSPSNRESFALKKVESPEKAQETPIKSIISPVKVDTQLRAIDEYHDQIDEIGSVVVQDQTQRTQQSQVDLQETSVNLRNINPHLKSQAQIQESISQQQLQKNSHRSAYISQARMGEMTQSTTSTFTYFNQGRNQPLDQSSNFSQFVKNKFILFGNRGQSQSAISEKSRLGSSSPGRQGSGGYQSSYVMELSPYGKLEFPSLKQTKDLIEDRNRKKVTLISGFMQQRLKKASVLNANLFRQDHIDYTQKIQGALKQLGEVLGKRKE